MDPQAPNPERVDRLLALFVRLWNPARLARVVDGEPEVWEPDPAERALIESATVAEVKAAMGVYGALVDAAADTVGE